MGLPLIQGTVRIDDTERDPYAELDTIAESIGWFAQKHKDGDLADLHRRMFELLRLLRGLTDQEEMEQMP